MVSPFGGFGSTAALAFVLIVAAVKAIFEDKKRHQEDHRTNKSTAHVVMANGTASQYLQLCVVITPLTLHAKALRADACITMPFLRICLARTAACSCSMQLDSCPEFHTFHSGIMVSL